MKNAVKYNNMLGIDIEVAKITYKDAIFRAFEHSDHPGVVIIIFHDGSIWMQDNEKTHVFDNPMEMPVDKGILASIILNKASPDD